SEFSAAVTVVAVPSISVNDATVTEGHSGTVNAVFTVSLSQASPLTVTVRCTTANGTATAPSDYSALNTTLTFAPGDLAKPISVVVNGDTTIEPTETFFVNLTNPINATVGDSQGLGTIVDDDTPGNLNGRVYLDLNNDGNFDPSSGETGIDGATVRLFFQGTSGDVLITELQTSAGGIFNFLNLQPGTYKMVEVQPSAFADGKEQVGTLGGSLPANDVIGDIVLPPATTGTLYGFGERKLGALNGRVYLDLNNDGNFDSSSGETGIDGATVRLFRTDSGSDVLITELQTSGGGIFNFLNLQPGTYKMAEVQPSAFADGKEQVGTLGGTLAANDVISDINVPAATVGTLYGFAERKLSNLNGRVYLDLNNDGNFDPSEGETGIDGVTVRLFLQTTSGDALVAEQQTSAGGIFNLLNLQPGTYKLVEVQPAAFADGKEQVGKLGGAPLGNGGSSEMNAPAATTGTLY